MEERTIIIILSYLCVNSDIYTHKTDNDYPGSNDKYVKSHGGIVSTYDVNSPIVRNDSAERLLEKYL